MEFRYKTVVEQNMDLLDKHQQVIIVCMLQQKARQIQ